MRNCLSAAAPTLSRLLLATNDIHRAWPAFSCLSWILNMIAIEVYSFCYGAVDAYVRA